MCGRRAPDLPIDVAPRIGKARTVVGQRHSAVQTVVKNEGSILVSRGELVWMGFEKLMLIFCWDAVSLSYSIHAYPSPSPVPCLPCSGGYSAASRSGANASDTHQWLCLSEVGHRNAEEEVEYHSTPLF
jgi:hypothetical protein